MILSQVDLRRAAKAGKIAFDPPLEERQWGEASVDLRLGFSFTKFIPVPGVTLDVSQGLEAVGHSNFYQTKILKAQDELGERESFVLRPHNFVLAMTYESIKVPLNMIALVEGRSTYARVGLSMHQTAPWIQPGWSGQIILEIMNNGELDIKLTPLVDRPCQITFFELKTAVPKKKGYGTRSTDAYQDQQHPLRHAKTKR
ncbi:MAG: dCTP deaminase [Alphaproteobacteria bacterium]|nr:dCTP deaminase [Alphaproteobacteria bacterium]MDE2631172.1 dCTP deaminase [Alphaproteobacteria bacterium]